MKSDDKLKDRYIEAKDELVKINEERNKLIKHDVEIEEAYKMLENAIQLMSEEKYGN